MRCPNCQFENPPGTRFCGQCGTSLAQACPSCGTHNPEGFLFCGTCGTRLTAAAPAARPSPEERKVITILFADLVGSTTLGERHDAERVRSIVGQFFEAMADAIDRYGGTVEKFVGDEVMAVFGLPSAHEDDPARAVHAALAMHSRLLELNDGLERTHGPSLQMRVGINTGEVVANPQAAAKGEFMVTGDAVNVAARLRSAAVPGTTLVGERTYRETRWLADYGACPPLALKGKADPVAAWQLVAIRAGATHRPPGTLRARLIGREDEYGLLQGLLQRAVRDRKPHLVTVLGQPGVGKSRLVDELTVTASSIMVRQGRSLPYGSTALWAVSEMLRADCGILRSDPIEQMRGKLQRRIDEVLADEPAREQIEGHLARILAIAGDTPAAAGEESRGGLFWSLRRFVESVAARSPLILLFEDIHWADPELLDLIEYLAQWTGGVPLLILGTARPELLELRQGWGGGKRNYTSLFLEPLTSADTAVLLRDLLQTDDVPDAAVNAVAVAEGNPFFVEEILHMLIDAGLLQRQNGDWRVARNLQVAVPHTVQGVVTARIDRLQQQEKALLLEASVLGKDFWAGALAHVTGHAVPSMDQLLRTLLTKDFLIERERSRLEGQREFTFKHIIIRDAAYQMLPKARRAEQHRAYGIWLEQNLQDQAESFVELFAHHWSQAAQLAREMGEAHRWAEASPKALRYMLAAARKAAHLYANEQAVTLFQTACDLASGLEAHAERVAAIEGLADVLALQAQWEEASRLYQEALDYHLQRGDLVRQAHVQSRIASTFSGVFDFRQALPHLQSAVAGLQSQQNERELAGVYIQLARTQAALGNLKEAEEHVRMGVQLAEQHSLLPQLAEAQYVLGFIHTLLGRPEAAEYYGKCVEIADQIDEPMWVILATQWNAYRHRWRGEFHDALTAYTRALELARKTNNRPRMAFCLIGLAQTHFYMGDWRTAAGIWREYLAMGEEVPAWVEHAKSMLTFLDGDLPNAINWAQKFIAHAERRREVTSIVLAIDWAAQLYMRTLRWEDARQLLVESLDQLTRIGVFWPALFHPAAAETMLALGDIEGAREHCHRAESYQWMNNRWAAARFEKATGLLHAAAESWDAASASLLKSVDLYRTIGNPYELTLTLESLAEISLGRTDRRDQDRAREALQEASQIYERLGADFEVRRLQESPSLK